MQVIVSLPLKTWCCRCASLLSCLGLFLVLNQPLSVSWDKARSESLRTRVTLETLPWDQAVRLELSLVLNLTGRVLSDAVALYWILWFTCCWWINIHRCPDAVCVSWSMLSYFHCASSSVVNLHSDFELSLPIVSSHGQTSGQACCLVQIGDSFFFCTVMELSPAGPLYHKHLTVSFASSLLCMSPFVLKSSCLSSGPYCFLLIQPLKTLVTLRSLSVWPPSLSSTSSLCLLGATNASKMRTVPSSPSSFSCRGQGVADEYDALTAACHWLSALTGQAYDLLYVWVLS